MDERSLKLEELRLLEEREAIRDSLPHLHGFPFYKWSREFFESRNFYNFLCAGNQISKSSTQIRKATHWATAVNLWPTLWRTKPLSFWYLYPSKEVATIEVEKKWIPEFLPRGAMKNHPIFGWREEYKNRWIWAIHFNSGVSIFFKSYSQDADVLQSGSPHAIFCDEELPFHLMPELSKRLLATDGHFHMVFTATLGQEEWRQTIEEIGRPKERFIHAAKWQISMRKDCLVYEDGSPSPWTPERIARAIAACQSQAEIDQRIDGRFVVAAGLKYESFDENRNVKPAHHLPKDWPIYVGIDIGTGGGEGTNQNHPAAIHFVACSPDYKQLRVFKGWRGDNEETSNGDILDKYKEMRGDMKPEMTCYDHQARDFYIIGTRAGEALTPADKSRSSGEGMLNTLFKTGMLVIYDEPGLQPLIQELKTLKKETPKTKAKDDAIDSLRYAITQIPIDWEALAPAKPDVIQELKNIRVDRWGRSLSEPAEVDLANAFSVEDEIEEANASYEY